MSPDSSDRAGLLRETIRAEAGRIDRQRSRNRRQAFALRIVVVLASATTTVLLGFKAQGSLGTTLTNVALVCSAAATVVLAWEAFYNPRSLWVIEVNHLAQLEALDRRLADMCARSSGPLDDADLDELRDAFEGLMTAHLAAWTSLRAQQAPAPLPRIPLPHRTLTPPPDPPIHSRDAAPATYGRVSTCGLASVRARTRTSAMDQGGWRCRPSRMTASGRALRLQGDRQGVLLVAGRNWLRYGPAP
ncbi:SLATT domain-containing protein [Actinomadura sp. ATCC 39365]